MIEINLLPVREEKRKADVRQFAAMLLATFAGSVVLAGLVHAKLANDVASTQSSLVELQRQIDAFKPQLEQVERYRATKQAIEAKLAVIDRLERSRSGPLHILTELSAHSPERLWLTGLSAEREQITVRGMSLDNELVALFMTALGDSLYFENVELQSTEAQDVDGLRLNEFELSATITIPGDPQPAAQPNVPAPGGAPASPGN
jgi:type IV pilus assembly protein PilN